MERTYRLVIACPDRVGIVAKVTTFLATYNGWLTEASHHSDPTNGWFYMRNEIKASSLPFDLNSFRIAFEPIAREFQMCWHVADSQQPKRIVLMASKESHCLADLLHRWHAKEMDGEIVGVISNHDDLRRMVEWHDIPYYYVPVDADDKSVAFAEVERLVDALDAEVVVLARYMQILPPELCDRYTGRIINIHHSFLPSFAGARPYHQAYKRGVKLIGATCHYVTQDLDEGPIIEQDVIRVNHSDTIEDMVRLGKDVEKQVLARGLRYHLEDRVIVHENKTIVFE
ncbi:formyltetrahydrofolate deformylase [Hahella sp. KA22]|uniref:formyltetrahydrofolate deformylase n=1 Tax=Hahella sp. KA22 TaxID=1628392 RepID=UPI000FDEBF15|nr:formyltetrahydrofolate deformylase [Hahella sp. KA22]AZZ91137.1 formyltetrahydrofolate deformylase [Hahella sp. KA22]QAY54505.1 formyltetrahydrofolate deformylase [Hahella sp. KA22]